MICFFASFTIVCICSSLQFFDEAADPDKTLVLH